MDDYLRARQDTGSESTRGSLLWHDYHMCVRHEEVDAAGTKFMFLGLAASKYYLGPGMPARLEALAKLVSPRSVEFYRTSDVFVLETQREEARVALEKSKVTAKTNGDALTRELQNLTADATAMKSPFTPQSYDSGSKLVKLMRTKSRWVESDEGKLYAAQLSGSAASNWQRTIKQTGTQADVLEQDLSDWYDSTPEGIEKRRYARCTSGCSTTKAVNYGFCVRSDGVDQGCRMRVDSQLRTCMANCE